MRFISSSSLVVVLLIAFGWSAPAHSQNGVTIRSLGLCLDAAGAATADGTNVQIWNCGPQVNQRWIFEGGQIRSAMAPNICLDVDGRGPFGDGTNVQIWQCNGGQNQRWNMDNGAIRSALPGNFCLDVDHGVAHFGTNVQIWTCNGGTNQQWAMQ